MASHHDHSYKLLFSHPEMVRDLRQQRATKGQPLCYLLGHFVTWPLCYLNKIEQDSLTDEPSAQPLFDNDGNLTETVQQTLNFLTQCDQNRQVTTAKASQLLDDTGLIEPWPLKLERGERQEPLSVQGLYRINEKALNDLAAEAFADLRKHGALALAYAQLFSMSQLSQSPSAPNSMKSMPSRATSQPTGTSTACWKATMTS